VPLIWNGPGLPAGRVVDAQVRLTDVAPTLLGLVAAPPLGEVAGRGLAPLWREAGSDQRIAYSETLATRLDHGWSPLFAVRSGRFKYVRAPRPELYDLEADPGETRNLAEAEPARAEELSRLLDERLAGARPLRPDLGASPEEIARLESLGYVVPAESAFVGDPTRVEGPDPKDRIGLLALMTQMERSFEEGRAEEFLADLDRSGEEGPIARSMRAMAAYRTGDAARAEREIRAALEATPGRADFLGLLGQTLEAQGRLDEAKAAYQEASRRLPESALAHVGLGRLAERAGDEAGAAAHFERAVETSEGSSEATWRLALLHLRAGRTEAADHLLAQVPPDDLAVAEAALALVRGEADAGLEARARSRLEALLARKGIDPEVPWRSEAETLARRLGLESAAPAHAAESGGDR
jgi:Tfp pilus assembly protein PilF